jgi:PD-(D/E)XK nuclease superfamily
MPLVGFIAEDGSGNYSFEETLLNADSQAFPFPYPIIKGIIESTQNRGDYISATSIIHCLRGDYLKRREDYYLTLTSAYPMFRGTLFHGLVEKYPHPMGQTEQKLLRTYRGVEIGGTYDSLVTLESEDEVGAKTYILQDWKTTKELPRYGTPYTNHRKQVNLYRWLARLPVKDVVLEVWYFSMDGVKRTVVPRKDVWSDEQVERYLDDRLLKLRASMVVDAPMPYALVPQEDKWECTYCPVVAKCAELSVSEQEQIWRRKHGLAPDDDLSRASQVAPFWEEVLDGIHARLGPVTANKPSTTLPQEPLTAPVAVPKPAAKRPRARGAVK